MSMKTPFFCLAFVGAALGFVPVQTAVAQNSAPTDQTNLSGGPSNSGGPGTPAPGQGQKFGRFKAALAQLDLTDGQKAQIKQIRATVTDRKERHQDVLAVLTTEQKAKLRELIQASRNES